MNGFAALDIPPCRRYVVVKATAGFAVCRLILKLLLFYSCLDFTQNLGKTRRFCADAGYRKTFEQDVKETLGLEVDISARIKPEWTILPKRWIVERTLAWINYSRRLSKDYEITVESAQAMCMIAALRTLIARF